MRVNAVRVSRVNAVRVSRVNAVRVSRVNFAMLSTFAAIAVKAAIPDVTVADIADSGMR
jgi:hypothetical protein